MSDPKHRNERDSRQSAQSRRSSSIKHHSRRSPTRQQFARHADYNSHTDSEHSVCSHYSNDCYEHNNRRCGPCSRNVDDQRDSCSDRSDEHSAGADYDSYRRCSDVHDDHHDRDSECSFDGYRTTHPTHDVYDNRSYDYDGGRDHHDDHGGGYNSHGDDHNGNCDSDYGGDYGGSCGSDYNSSYDD